MRWARCSLRSPSPRHPRWTPPMAMTSRARPSWVRWASPATTSSATPAPRATARSTTSITCAISASATSCAPRAMGSGAMSPSTRRSRSRTPKAMSGCVNTTAPWTRPSTSSWSTTATAGGRRLQSAPASPMSWCVPGSTEKGRRRPTTLCSKCSARTSTTGARMTPPVAMVTIAGTTRTAGPATLRTPCCRCICSSVASSTARSS